MMIITRKEEGYNAEFKNVLKGESDGPVIVNVVQ